VRIAVAALGTRGDVVPYVVLGRALAAAGHDVMISTTARFRGLVEGAALGFHALPGDPSDASDVIPTNISPWRPRHHINALYAAVDALVGQTDPALLREGWADRDFIIFSSSTTFAHVIAAQLGAGSAMVVMTPGVSTGAFAHPLMAPGLGLGAHGNLASWLIGERLQRQTFKEPLKPRSRRPWRLPPLALSTRRAGATWPPFPIIHAYSPAVVPQPPDWPAHVATTGWLLPEPSTDPLPDHVEQFLAAGPPPLYVGFGSMPVPDPETTAQLLLGALQRTGQRAIVCGTALAQSAALQDAATVLTATELPHQHLLPHVRALIHHGGSGTTGAGLHAGKPTLITPYIFDQFFWGHRINKLGAGPKPIPFGRLTEARLTRAIAQLTSGDHDAPAHALGQHLDDETPAAAAIHHLEQTAAAI
jgi:sterol 3beta-glucosyltransferase